MSTADNTDGANGGTVAFADNPAAEPWNVSPAALDAVAGNITLQATNDITITDDVFGDMVLNGVNQAGVSGPAGDNGNDVLELGETWIYTLATIAPTPPLDPAASTDGRCVASSI